MKRKKGGSIFPWDPALYREPVRSLLSFLRFAEQVWNRLQEKNCFIRASGLAYSSLLAVVPLATILLTLFTAFGSFREAKEMIENFLVTQLIPASQAGILDLLNTFIENAKALGVVGLLLFGVTSVLLLDSINSNFNAIWGCPARKQFLRKFTTYTSIIVVGSLLLSAGIGLSSMTREIFPGKAMEAIPFFERLATRVVPSLSIFIGVLLMVIAIPQTKVKFTSALIGALSGALLWEFIRYWFHNLTNYVFRMSVIYGSLAAIPIFLFWLYITWIIILVSLVVTHVHQHRDQKWTGGNITERLPSEQLNFGIDLLCAIASSFTAGDPPPTTETLSKRFSVANRDVAHFIALLQEGGIILQTQGGNGWVPSRPPERISVSAVLRLFYGSIAPAEEVTENTRRLLYRFGQSAFSAVEGDSLDSLIK